MNRQTAALSDALYEKREALDALREEAQNLRVTLAACERDANALNQDGARMRREQSAVGVQIGEAHENREALTLRHQQSMAAARARCRRAADLTPDGLRRLSRIWRRGRARATSEQETIRQLTQRDRQPARDAGHGYGQVPQGRAGARRAPRASWSRCSSGYGTITS